MEKTKMIEIRNWLYKCALIGFIVMIIGIVFCMCFPRFMEWYVGFLFGVGPRAVRVSILMSFVILKTAVIVFFLIPALALHWQYMEKK